MSKQVTGKKLLILLTMIMSIVLIGCSGNSSNKKDIEEELQGKWICYQTIEGIDISCSYEFENGQVYATLGTFDPNVGTYKIDNSVVTITYGGGGEVELPYTYTNGNLSLEMLGVQLYKEEDIKQSIKATEEQIESVALDAVYNYLKSVYDFKWDIPSTQYETGSITALDGGKGYEVKGVLYLYNDYGEYADKARFSVTVKDKNGKMKAETPEIDVQ